MNAKPRFAGLEWLRLSLGVFVMIYHTAPNYPQFDRVPWLKDMTSMGLFATSTFFVLSGFLLAHVYFNNNEMREPAKSFWVKRFCNLYPIHIVALALSVLVLLLMHQLSIPPNGPGATPRFVIYDTNDISGQTHPELYRHYMSDKELVFNAVLQLFMLQAWNPLYLTFNAPLWSLSTLFFFYLVFPFAASRLLQVRHVKTAIAVLCALYLLPPLFVVSHALWGIPWTGLLQRFPPLRLPEFLCGILCYSLFRSHQRQGVRLSQAHAMMLSLFVLCCFVAGAWVFTHRPERIWYPLLHNGLLLPSQLTLVYLCAWLPDPGSAWLQRNLPRMGAASLSIFALHVPLFHLWTTFEPLLRSIAADRHAGWQQWVSDAGATAPSLTGYAAFLLLSIWICLHFQEQFVVRVRKAMLRRISLNEGRRHVARPI